MASIADRCSGRARDPHRVRRAYRRRGRPRTHRGPRGAGQVVISYLHDTRPAAQERRRRDVANALHEVQHAEGARAADRNGRCGAFGCCSPRSSCWLTAGRGPVELDLGMLGRSRPQRRGGWGGGAHPEELKRVIRPRRGPAGQIGRRRRPSMLTGVFHLHEQERRRAYADDGRVPPRSSTLDQPETGFSERRGSRSGVSSVS